MAEPYPTPALLATSWAESSREATEEGRAAPTPAASAAKKLNVLGDEAVKAAPQNKEKVNAVNKK